MDYAAAGQVPESEGASKSFLSSANLTPLDLFAVQVFLNTVIVNTTRNAAGDIVALTGVQRTAASGYQPYTDNLSQELPDWYSPQDSHRFTKTMITLTGKV